MFNNLKEILLKEILEQVEYADKVYDEISDLEKELNFLSEPENDIALIEPSNPDKYYSTISKILMYKKYKQEKKEYEYKKEEYDNKILKQENEVKEYKLRKSKIKKRLQELKTICESKKLDDIRKQYKAIKEANNIKELGYSFKQIQELFEQNNIPLVLDETDDIIKNESNFDKLEDLVLIHKTNYAPTNNEIKTTKNSNVQHKEKIQIGNEQIEINFNKARDTIHFAVNGEVGSHFYGSWDGMKYAVVIPFTEVSNIVNFSTGDTYSKGNVDISKGYLLCPEEEIEQIKKNNLQLTIIGYKGKSVDGIADAFITMLGYKKESVGTHGWENKDSEKALNTVSNKTNIRIGEHSGSVESKEENVYTGINQFNSIINQLLEKKLDYDVELATNQLLGIGETNDIQLRLPIDYNILTLHDGEVFTNFIKELENNNIIIPNYILDMFVSKKYYNSDVYSNSDIPSDVKSFVEKYDNDLKQSYSNTRHSFDYFEKVFVYEILKQIKELNMNNTNSIKMHEEQDVKKL